MEIDFAPQCARNEKRGACTIAHPTFEPNRQTVTGLPREDATVRRNSERATALWGTYAGSRQARGESLDRNRIPSEDAVYAAQNSERIAVLQLDRKRRIGFALETNAALKSSR